jgi:Flp pilus assembly protein TadD
MEKTEASVPRGRVAWLAAGLALAAILAATFLAYWPALDGSFVLDDWITVKNNVEIRRPEALRVPGLARMLGTSRPITEATYALDWRAVGLDPRRYHAVGLALHLAAACAAFAFLLRLLRRAGHPRATGVAVVVAGLFALHPMQSDAVAYVAQRSELLSGGLYLVALLLLDAAVSRWGSRRGVLAAAAGAGGWVVAMGAKATAISLPGAFVADQLVVAPPGERGSRALRSRALRALAVVAPVFLLMAWAAWLQVTTLEAHPEGGAGFSATTLSWWQYLLTQLRVVWLYLRLLAWPSGLAFDRTFRPSTGPDGAVLLAGAGVVALVALALWLWYRAERSDRPEPASRLAAFGILFWFVALSPTSTIVPVLDLAVEHRVYLPSLGVFLAATVAVDALLHRRLPARHATAVAAGLAVLVLAGLGLALRARAQVWSSAEELWRQAAAVSPDSARIQTNLGMVLHERGDVAGAEAAYERAWPLARDVDAAIPLARNHAWLLHGAGRYEEALAVVERGLVALPADGPLRALRAVTLLKFSRFDEAEQDSRAAVLAAPDDATVHGIRGQVLSQRGDWAGALRELETAMALDPGAAIHEVGVAVALAALGRRDEACQVLRTAAERSGARELPMNGAMHALELGCPVGGNPAVRLIDEGRAEEALAILDRAAAVSPGDAMVQANRAAALGKMGRNAEALEAARRAARIAPDVAAMRNVYGQALAVNKDWAAALVEFQESEKLSPANPLYPVQAAVALTALKRRAEACAALARASGKSGGRPLPLDAGRLARSLGCPVPAP